MQWRLESRRILFLKEERKPRNHASRRGCYTNFVELSLRLISNRSPKLVPCKSVYTMMRSSILICPHIYTHTHKRLNSNKLASIRRIFPPIGISSREGMPRLLPSIISAFSFLRASSVGSFAFDVDVHARRCLEPKRLRHRL